MFEAERFPAAGSPFIEFGEASRKAASADVALLSDNEALADTLLALEAQACGEAAVGHLLADLERRGVCDREFGLTTASWVAHHSHGSRPALAGRVKTALTLRRLPVVDDALSDGVISPEHARVMASVTNPRTEADVVDLQHELVDLAQRCPFPAWRRHVTEVTELLDQDGGFDPDRYLARNQLRVSPNGSDGVTLAGELVGLHALGFTEALEAETDRLWRRYRNDHDECGELPVPERSTLRALALVELIGKGAAGAAPSGKGPTVDISLVIHDDHPDRAISPQGIIVTRDVQRHLGCDPTITPIWINRNAPPDNDVCRSPGCSLPRERDTVTVDVGRGSRYATPAQRRALAARDGGCVFPGCDIPVGWCDAHHVVAWQHGGATDLANLAMLCRHHHGVTHRRGWTMTAEADQTFTWTTPNGQTLESQHNRGGSGPAVRSHHGS